jgi:thymidylate synthase (FAD)
MNSITVLDKGFVSLDDSTGGDLDVVNGARVSFQKHHKQMEEGDDKLINFLMKHRHGTPFELAWFKFHIKCPISVAREWMRHRMSSFNEVSGRYVKLEPEFYVPSDDFIRKQEGKPGHYKFVPIYDPPKLYAIRFEMEKAYDQAYDSYEKLMDMGLAKEVARQVLPVGLYTEFFYACNARSLMNFFSLRSAGGAMKEIREYSLAMEKLFAKQMPISYACFIENGRTSP